MKINSQQNNNGFTLIETLVAISIFTMSILGLITILASGISNTNYAKQKVAAIYLAQEGIEYARNQRDSSVILRGGQIGWENFRDNALDLSSLPSTGSGFTRTITKVPAPGNSDDEVTISSTVTVSQASGNYTVTLSEDLFNWVE